MMLKIFSNLVLSAHSLTSKKLANYIYIFMLSGNWKLGADYFREEFTLNYVMATYSKPQVNLGYGVILFL